MLADDEEGIRALVSATLGDRTQYQVLLARDGNEALRIARWEKPDLLFLDVLLPGLDGYEVCRALKEDADTAYIKIIMLTALAQESGEGKAFAAGADGYLSKPFSPAALLERVREVLALS